MQTPNTKAGQVTEEVMRIFWVPTENRPAIHLDTPQYNAIYAHVLAILTKAFEQGK